MTGIINLFLPLFIVVWALYIISRLLNRLILQNLGRGWYLATMWPGVVAHELSHLVACLVTFTKVYRVHLFQPTEDSLGLVEHARSFNPLKNVLIAIAPLFGVTAIIWLLTKWFWPDLYHVQLSDIRQALTDFQNFHNFFNFSQSYFGQYWHYVKDLFFSFDLYAWQTYVFIYLMLALSAHAAPSKTDLDNAAWGLLGLLLLFALIYYLDQWLNVPLTWNIVKILAAPVFFALSLLVFGIIFALISLLIISVFTLLMKIFRKRGMMNSV